MAQENKLLRSQLKMEREKQYRINSELTEEERRELNKNRKTLERKGRELEETQTNLDKARIELIQMQHALKTDKVQAETLKKENQDLKMSLTRVGPQPDRANMLISMPPPASSRESLD